MSECSNTTTDIAITGVVGLVAGAAFATGCLLCPPIAALGFAAATTISILGAGAAGAGAGASTGAIVAAAKGNDIKEGAVRGVVAGCLAGIVGGTAIAIGAYGYGLVSTSHHFGVMGLIESGHYNIFIENYSRSLWCPLVGYASGFCAGLVDGYSRKESVGEILSRAIEYGAIGNFAGTACSGLFDASFVCGVCFTNNIPNSLGCGIVGLIPSAVVGAAIGLVLVELPEIAIPWKRNLDRSACKEGVATEGRRGSVRR